MRTCWTDQQTELLRQMWAAGRSGSDIGAELGYSRNAILGKAHRLGLGAHKDAGGFKPAKSKPSQPRRPFPPSQAVPMPTKPSLPLPQFPPQAVIAMRRLQLWELGERMCRWPIGDPQQKGFYFCGADADLGCVYCPHHMRRAFSKTAGG